MRVSPPRYMAGLLAHVGDLLAGCLSFSQPDSQSGIRVRHAGELIHADVLEIVRERANRIRQFRWGCRSLGRESRYSPPPNVAKRALAATASFAAGSGPKSALVCSDTALRTVSKATQTCALGSSDCSALTAGSPALSAGSPGVRMSAQMATPMAITAIARAAGATHRDGVRVAGWEDVVLPSACAFGVSSGMRR